MKTKTAVVICAFLFSSINTFSQAPTKQGDADFGGSENDQFAAGQQTNDGGYIWGGYSESGISGDKTQASRGSSDYWIVKTNANGVKQWDARFGGTSVDQLTCLQQTEDGGYILGGISFSGIGGDKTQSSQGSSDYWIVKINKNGNKQWDARFGGAFEDELHSIQQTSDGGYILGGASISGISGDKTQESRGGKDFWILKTDANGTKQWDARFGGTAFEELFSIRQSKDGGYIMGGYSLSDPGGDKTDPSRGRYDYWIVKTNADGVKQWDASYGGKDDDWLTQIRQTKDGGYILGGWSWSGSTGDKSQPSKGDNDYWIIKIDARGVRRWDAAFGGSSNDYLTPVEQTADGGYILGGYSSSPVSGDKTQAGEGGTDYWMVKTDVDGVKQWDADFGGSEFDFLYALQQTKDGGYVLGGYSSSNTSGDKTQDSKGLNDYWIVKTTADGVSCNIPVNLRTVNIRSDGATLRWESISGVNNYNVIYRTRGFGNWTILNAKDNRKQLDGLFAGTDYEWAVRSVCNAKDSVVSERSVKQTFTTSASLKQSADSKILSRHFVGEVYPNPVSQSATVSFSLAKASPVKIVVTDVNGRSLKTIADADFSTGNHLIKFNRESLMAGIYFLQIKTNQGTVMKKILIE
jgi:hypothetical protein